MSETFTQKQIADMTVYYVLSMYCTTICFEDGERTLTEKETKLFYPNFGK